jgi:hypothetical protein
VKLLPHALAVDDSMQTTAIVTRQLVWLSVPVASSVQLCKECYGTHECVQCCMLRSEHRTSCARPRCVRSITDSSGHLHGEQEEWSLLAGSP